MEADDSNRIRVTSGKGESFPKCSPDGEWIAYLDTSKDWSFGGYRLKAASPPH